MDAVNQCVPTNTVVLLALHAYSHSAPAGRRHPWGSRPQVTVADVMRLLP